MPHFFALRMRTQLILMFCPILTSVLLLLVGAHFIHQNITFNILTRTSETLLAKGSLEMQTLAINEYDNLCRALFGQTFRTISSINSLYQYSQLQNYTSTQPQLCPPETNPYPSYFYIDQTCYIPQGSQDLQKYENSTLADSFLKLQSTVNSHMMEFDITKTFLNLGFYWVLNTSDQLLAAWPQFPAIPYLPQSRPWYINHMNQSKQYPLTDQFYSPLYKFAEYSGTPSKLFGITQTQSLIYKNQIVGVIGIDIDFSLVQRLIKNYKDLNILLLYYNGTILFQNTFIDIDLISRFDVTIYDQQRTGFNYTDWVLMVQASQGDKNITLYNSRFGFDVLINIKLIKETPFYLVIFNNFIYQDQQEQLEEILLTQLRNDFLTMLEIFIIVASLIFIVAYFMIIVILYPINNIKYAVRSKNLTQKLQYKEIKTNNQLQLLKQIIFKRHNQLQYACMQKSELCLLIEKFQYLKINKIIKLRMPIGNLEDVDSFCNDIFYFALKQL